MAKKPVGELTQHEVALLTISARLLAALKERTARPPGENTWQHWDKMAGDELVHCKTCILYN